MSIYHMIQLCQQQEANTTGTCTRHFTASIISA